MDNAPTGGFESSLPWEALPALFPELGEPARWLPLLQRHAGILEAARPRVRASAVEGPAVVRRQYAESLELLRIAREVCAGNPVIDVGSGGGFPGLVIAAVEPATLVHLVEPTLKKAALLETAARELGLVNVTVHAVRAEDAARGPLREVAALVTARAVAELRVLVEYTAPFARPGGLLVLPKGSALEAEVAAAANAMDALGCSLRAVVPMRPEVSEAIRVVLTERRGALPAAFPRRAGVAARRPL